MTAKTPTQRMKDMRDRIKSSGGKTVSVSIPPDLNRLIEQMLRDEQSGHKNIAAIIRAGIRAVYADYIEPDLISEKSGSCIALIQQTMRISKGQIIEQALCQFVDLMDCDDQYDEDDDEEFEPHYQPSQHDINQDPYFPPVHYVKPSAQQKFEESEDTLEF